MIWQQYSSHLGGRTRPHFSLQVPQPLNFHTSIPLFSSTVPQLLPLLLSKVPVLLKEMESIQCGLYTGKHGNYLYYRMLHTYCSTQPTIQVACLGRGDSVAETSTD